MNHPAALGKYPMRIIMKLGQGKELAKEDFVPLPRKPDQQQEEDKQGD